MNTTFVIGYVEMSLFVKHIVKNGVHIYYVVCNETNHYVGGTSSGRDFLQTNPHIPASFLISTKPGLSIFCHK